MTGTIKFYNKEKGFGFIFCNELNNDIYFSISDWKMASVPNANDDIEFEIYNGKKSKAINIKLLKSATEKNTKSSNHNLDDRIICPGCNKKIVPRMVTYRGEADKTLCPYCATVIKSFMQYNWLPIILIGIGALVFFSVILNK